MRLNRVSGPPGVGRALSELQERVRAALSSTRRDVVSLAATSTPKGTTLRRARIAAHRAGTLKEAQ